MPTNYLETADVSQTKLTKWPGQAQPCWKFQGQNRIRQRMINLESSDSEQQSGK